MKNFAPVIGCVGVSILLTLPVVRAAAPATDQTWTGTWTRTEPAVGSGQLTLTVADDGKGTIRLHGSVCLSEATPASVTLTEKQVRIAVKTGGQTAAFVGTRSGNALTGTMTVSCSAGERGTVRGKGTWQAAKS